MTMPGTSLVERERQAYSMLARGLSIKSIARILHLSEATITKYVKRHKEEMRTLVNKISQEDYAGMVLSRFEQIRQEIYANYQSAETEGDRFRYLRLAMDLEVKEQKSLTDLGLLERQPEKTEHSINTTVLVESTDKAELEALTLTLLSKRIGKTPEELISMSGKNSKNNIYDVYPVLSEAKEKEKNSEVSPVLEKIDLD